MSTSSYEKRSEHVVPLLEISDMHLQIMSGGSMRTGYCFDSGCSYTLEIVS